jgi:hypothetical protein
LTLIAYSQKLATLIALSCQLRVWDCNHFCHVNPCFKFGRILYFSSSKNSAFGPIIVQ